MRNRVEPPRSLADQLRGWDDERLTVLLSARPDLATPAPVDCAQLASRAATRASLLRVLDQLSRLHLCVLDALVVSRRNTIEEIGAIVLADPDAVRSSVRLLVDLAVVWESPDGLRALSGVAEALGASRTGLHEFSAGDVDLAEVEKRLAGASPAARAMLEHLDAHGGVGTSERLRPGIAPEEAETPAQELLARRLVLAREREVRVPGEVGVVLRGGHTTSEPVDRIPELATSDRDRSLVARTAAGAAFESVRRIELLLDHWGTAPPTALRSGGLGVRDLKAAATYLHADEPTTALLVEVAAAAGLLATGADDAGTTCWLPTDAFDAWCQRDLADRWHKLATAWLSTARIPGLAGTRDSAGKTVNALAPDSAGLLAEETRRMALTALEGLPEGQVLAVGTGVPSVAARLEWQRPRRPRTRADLAVWALREADVLGVSGAGGLSEHGRALLGEADPDPVIEALAPLLPDPVDHVLLQADLTAVAPGPLESQLAGELQLLADIESRGGATVYRFSASSVRRGFDAGWTASEVHAFLARVSRTPVPQPLTYLVDDVSRTFGSLRLGMAEAFLRADEEAVLTELLHHPRAASLGLRRIAPTVLVSSTPADLLLPRLRELGVAPVVEAPDGTVAVARRDVLRARTPRARRSDGVTRAREQAHVAQVVAAVRAGERASRQRPDRAGASPASPGSSLATLREAVESRTAVWIGYVDNHGTSSERIVDPIRVEGGHLTAYDHRSEDVRSFAVHRVTAVRPIADRG